MNPKIRILLVDDHALVRKGFRMILNSAPDIEVIGETGKGEEAIKMVFAKRPDVVVMDIAMPDITGVEATRRILQQVPETRILILSMYGDAIYVRETLRAGARGYLLKDSVDTEFVTAIRAVARGEGSLSSAVSSTVLEDYQKFVTHPLDKLTNRERQILQLLAQGNTAKDVAASLNISPYTVDAHRSRVLKKLQLRGATDMVRFALQHGMIT